MKPKPINFEVIYTRADEPEKNYSHIYPLDFLLARYPAFNTFARRAEVGDTAQIVLGTECWAIKRI